MAPIGARLGCFIPFARDMHYISSDSTQHHRPLVSHLIEQTTSQREIKQGKNMW